MLHKITVSLEFTCSQCGGGLGQIGAIRTDDDLFYIVGHCDICEETIPIPIDKIIAALYQESDKKVN